MGFEEESAQLAYPNKMKEQLQAGQVVSAMSIRYSRGIEIVGYAKAAGMNGVLIDLEHRYGHTSIYVRTTLFSHGLEQLDRSRSMRTIHHGRPGAWHHTSGPGSRVIGRHGGKNA